MDRKLKISFVMFCKWDIQSVFSLRLGDRASLRHFSDLDNDASTDDDDASDADDDDGGGDDDAAVDVNIKSHMAASPQ